MYSASQTVLLEGVYVRGGRFVVESLSTLISWEYVGGKITWETLFPAAVTPAAAAL